MLIVSKMLKWHVLKLVFRLLLLVAALLLYAVNDAQMLDFTRFFELGVFSAFLWIVWAFLVLEMMFRIIPNKKIAIGARKHYACSYKAVSANEKAAVAAFEASEAKRNLHKGVVLSAVGWLAVTAAVLFALHLIGILTAQTVLLWMLLLAVADLVFVVFFCPFQVLFMRNRCCEDCRIYNWDYFMMCAPLILFPSFFSVSLVLISLAVLIRWEIAVYKNPQYFMEGTNINLRCGSCDDKLCKLRLNVNRK